MNSTAARSSGDGGSGSGRVLAEGGELGERVTGAERRLGGRGDRACGDPHPGPAQGAGDAERGGHADDPVGPRAVHGAGHAAQAETGIRHDDHRADAEACVEGGGEVGTGRDEQGYPLAPPHADGEQSGGDRLDAAGEQAPRDSADGGPAVRPHLDQRSRRLVPPRLEHAPERLVLGGPLRLRLRPGAARRDLVGVEPREHGGGDVGVLGHEVARAFEAVHVRVRHPAHQVGEVALLEHGIGRPPEQQHRHGQPSGAVRDAAQLRRRGVLAVRGDVAHELPDPASPGRRGVRGPIGRPHVRGERRMGDRERGVEEGCRGRRAGPRHRRREREPQQERQRVEVRVVQRRVREHDAGGQRRMVDGPAERDDPAPVVAERHDRAGQAELVGEHPEVGDPLRDRARHVGALGPAHLELVDGDHAPRPRGFRRSGDDVAPEEAPGGVAVHGEDRADGGHARRGERLPAVEQVPGAALTVRGRGLNEARPRRIEPGQALRRSCRGSGSAHHASSSIEVLMPLPMPQSSTRSPLCSFEDSCASVIGIDAGPTLPYAG